MARAWFLRWIFHQQAKCWHSIFKMNSRPANEMFSILGWDLIFFIVGGGGGRGAVRPVCCKNPARHTRHCSALPLCRLRTEFFSSLSCAVISLTSSGQIVNFLKNIKTGLQQSGLSLITRIPLAPPPPTPDTTSLFQLSGSLPEN